MIFPYNSLYTQTVSYTTYFELGKPVATLIIITISNSNWTEGSTIQGVIARVNLKSDEREARGRYLKLRARLLGKLYDTRSNYSLILLHDSGSQRANN